MTAVKYDLELEAGASWSLGVRYLLPPDADGLRASAIPEGWIATLQFRRHPNDVTTLISYHPSINYDDGAFTMYLSAAQTRSLPVKCVWGVEVAHPDGDPAVRLIEGTCSVSMEIVR